MSEKKKPYIPKKKERTGEDIDMLHERDMEPESYSNGSYRYRDHIDSY